MKIAIIFHSVCGNTYLLAKAFEQAFSQQGSQVSLLRVQDASWKKKEDVSLEEKQILLAMRALPEVTAKDLLEADLIIMGSPTYFGNVTAQMKMFMDSLGAVWFKGQLVGKKFIAFATAGNPEGGVSLCLQALHIFAHYMGMLSIPLPITTLPGENLNALGIVHYASGKYVNKLDLKTQKSVEAFVSFVTK